MTISLDSVYEKMTEAVGKTEDELAKFMETMDPNNTADMLKLQQLTQKWTMATNLSSNMMTTLKDATKNVISNMR